MAAKLVSMKIDKAEREKMMEGPASLAAGDYPEYPWGMCLELDDSSLTKLGMTELPEVGENYMLIAKVSVTSVSSNETANGGKSRRVSLQVTDLALEAEAKDVKTVSDAMYGKGDK